MYIDYISVNLKKEIGKTSFLNRTLAGLGIGSARVNAYLEKNSYMVGEEVRGAVHIEGGKVDQQIDQIYMYIKTQYAKESDDKKIYITGEVAKFRISEPFFSKPVKGEKSGFLFFCPVKLRLPKAEHRYGLKRALIFRAPWIQQIAIKSK